MSLVLALSIAVRTQLILSFVYLLIVSSILFILNQSASNRMKEQ
jgi:hypothetical protein